MQQRSKTDGAEKRREIALRVLEVEMGPWIDAVEFYRELDSIVEKFADGRMTFAAFRRDMADYWQRCDDRGLRRQVIDIWQRENAPRLGLGAIFQHPSQVEAGAGQVSDSEEG